MDQIRKHFEKYVAINEEDWEVFTSKLKSKEVKKKTSILKMGTIENHLSFIVEGTVRLLVPKIENDLTFGFCFKDQFVSAYDSFLTRTPSKYEIETLTNTKLWQLTFDDLQDIYERTSIGNVIGRITAENLFLIKVKREQSLLNDSAEERYLKLFTEKPHLIKEIPLKYLASYIGITPQALSRIRRRIT